MTAGGASVRRLFEFLLTDHSMRTYTDLAVEMDISRSTVSNLAQGKTRLSAKQILFIHEHFGVEIWKIRELSGQYDTAKEKPACGPAR